MATAHAGQFLPESPPDDGWAGRTRELAVACGLDAAELRLALDHVPVLDQGAEHQLSRLLKKAALTFSEIGEERLRLIGRLQRIAEITQL